MKKFVEEYINDRPKFIARVREVEVKRHLNLVGKILKERNEINLDSWESEMKFGIFFDSIAENLEFEKQIDLKKPDWSFQKVGQKIIAEVLRINPAEDELLGIKKFEKQFDEHNKKNKVKLIGYSTGVKILSSEYFYGHESKVLKKESSYRELIQKYQLPYIICIDSTEDTFVSELDVFDAFLGNDKRGIFYQNEEFAKNVTGILFRYFLNGKFHYYHNESSLFKLNKTNNDIFNFFQYIQKSSY